MRELQCPYCDHWQEPSPDIHEPDVAHEHECHECEKNFMYEIDYVAHYTSKKADCLNGGDHDWFDVVSTAKIAYDGVKECRGCGKYNKQPNWKGENDAMEKEWGEK